MFKKKSHLFFYLHKTSKRHGKEKDAEHRNVFFIYIFLIDVWSNSK